MNWLRAILSALDRLLLAGLLGRSPRFTLSAEAEWMRRYGDTPHELQLGAWLVPVIEALPFNRRGHCAAALKDHLTWAAGRLARAAAIDQQRGPS